MDSTSGSSEEEPMEATGAACSSGSSSRRDALMMCPYNPYHRMPSWEFATHVEKCRETDKIRRLRDKLPVGVFACRHCKELCHGPELVSHEAECPKRDIVPNVGPIEGKVELVGFPNTEEYDSDDEDEEDLNEGVEFGVIRGAHEFSAGKTLPQMFAELGLPKYGTDDDEQPKPVKKEEAETVKKPEATSAKVEYGRNKTPTSPGFDVFKNNPFLVSSGASSSSPPTKYGWKTCPYNLHHTMPPNKFVTHVAKCRRADKLRKLQNQVPVEVFACKYCNELCYGPELIPHETGCYKRDVVRSYQLNIGPLEGKVDLGGCPNLEEYESDDREEAEMYAGVEFGVIRGAHEFRAGKTLPQMFAELGLPKYDLDDDEPAQTEEAEPAKKPEETPAKDELEDEEWWNRPPTGPGFDMIKNNPFLRNHEASRLSAEPDFSEPGTSSSRRAGYRYDD